MDQSVFGERIRDERKRLSLSQTELAQRVGISMRTQRNYETGTRVPDASYLAAVGKLGVDVGLVVTGARTGAPLVALQKLVEELAARIGVPPAALKTLYAARLASEEEVMDREPWPWNPHYVCETRTENQVNAELLAAALETLEGHLKARGATLSSVKKAHAVAVLYRYLSKVGPPDSSVLDSLLEIAQ